MLKKALATGAMLALAASAVQAQTVCFYDSESNATTYNVTATPRQYVGQAYNTATSSGSTVTVTGMDFALYTVTAMAYTDIVANIYFWGSYNPSSTTNVFSNLLAVEGVDFGAFTPQAGGFYDITDSTDPNNNTPGATGGIVFNTPIVLPSTNNLGVTIVFAASTAAAPTLATTNNLTSIERTGANAIGTEAANGFFKSAGKASPNDGNFDSTDLTTITGTNPNSGLYMRLYGTVAAAPEPSQYAAFGLGLLGLGALALKARRRSIVA